MCSYTIAVPSSTCFLFFLLLLDTSCWLQVNCSDMTCSSSRTWAYMSANIPCSPGNSKGGAGWRSCHSWFCAEGTVCRERHSRCLLGCRIAVGQHWSCSFAWRCWHLDRMRSLATRKEDALDSSISMRSTAACRGSGRRFTFSPVTWVHPWCWFCFVLVVGFVVDFSGLDCTWVFCTAFALGQ